MTEPHRKTCARETCDKPLPRHSHRNHCSSNCAVLARVAAENARIRNVIGPCLAADQLLEAERDLIEAYDDIVSIRRNIKLMAEHAGIDSRTWFATIRNRQPAQEPQR